MANQENGISLRPLPENFLKERDSFDKESQIITIDSDQEFEYYGERLRGCAALVKAIEGYHERTRKMAYDLWKALVKQIEDSTATPRLSVARYEKALIQYRHKKRQEAETKRIAEQQAAQKQHDDLYVQSAEQLEAAGDHAAAEMVIEQGAQMTAVVSTPVEEVPKVKGLGFKEDFDFDIVDATGKIAEDSPLLPREYLIPNEKAIRKIVKALGMKANIPGIRVRPVDRVSKRTS